MSKIKPVLVIDKSQPRLQRIKSMLEPKYEVVDFQNIKEAIAYMQENIDAQVVLLDYHFSDSVPGTALIEDIFRGEPLSEVIVLLDKESHEDTVASMKSKAYCCLVEPLRDHELKNKIRNAFKHVECIHKIEDVYIRESYTNLDINNAFGLVKKLVAKRMLEGKSIEPKEFQYIFATNRIQKEEWSAFVENVEKQKKEPGQRVIDKPTILVVDDKDRLRFMIKLALEPYCNILEAGNAEEAMQECEDNVIIDVVFLDIRMPGAVQGNNIMPKIQKSHPEAEIVVMTAYRETDIAVEVLDRGAFTYLNKPFDPEDIVVTFNEALMMKYLKQIVVEVGDHPAKYDESNLIVRIRAFEDYYIARIDEGEKVFVKELYSRFPGMILKGFGEEDALPCDICKTMSEEDPVLYWLASNAMFENPLG